jgi:hypothetical protein
MNLAIDSERLFPKSHGKYYGTLTCFISRATVCTPARRPYDTTVLSQHRMTSFDLDSQQHFST